MGKNGDLLRQKKKQNTVYTFTAEQLQKHDMEVRKLAYEHWRVEFEQRSKAHQEQVQKEIREEWDKRQAMIEAGDRCTDVYTMLQYMLSITVKVLCDKFGWAREKEGQYHPRLRINTYADCVADEIARICASEMEDIRNYSDKVAKEYGIRFKFTQEEA